MELTITNEAAQWYEDELNIEDGKYLRFHVRYGGVGGLVPGFSLGVNMDEPQMIFTSCQINNITFFIEESDAWYFEDKKSLTVTIDENSSEPVFTYE